MSHHDRSFPPRVRVALNRTTGHAILAVLLLLFSVFAEGQNTPYFPQTIANSSRAGGAPGQKTAQPLSLKTLPASILGDQKPVWLFPIRAAGGHHWKPALAVALATTGLVFLDSHDAPYFQRTHTYHGFNRVFSGTNTGIAEGTFPLALYLAGKARHSGYMEQTALQATEALADAQIVSEIMKNVDRRLRPREIPPNGDFGHTWFKAGSGILIDRGSFPSGHVIGAFAVATVIAERYRRHRWVPWVAYGAAALVGFSRISLQAHFTSDVFAGAALGYSISHFVVLRRHQE
jgi:membrane-associated phospholipid phosphatase